MILNLNNRDNAHDKNPDVTTEEDWGLTKIKCEKRIFNAYIKNNILIFLLKLQ